MVRERTNARSFQRARALSFCVPLVLGTACAIEPRDDLGSIALAHAETEPVARPIHVDSIFPIDEQIRRFREGMPEVASLEAGERSIEALVRRFVAAISTHDSASIAPLRITPQEFVYLYYPHTTYTRKPYEMGPGLLWFQMDNFSSRGIHRALQRLGGKELTYHDHRCHDQPEVQEHNRIWNGCVVTLAIDGTDPEPIALFGSIIERDGQYKFLSFSNRL